jgi:hypothetical protein
MKISGVKWTVFGVEAFLNGTAIEHGIAPRKNGDDGSR